MGNVGEMSAELYAAYRAELNAERMTGYVRLGSMVARPRSKPRTLCANHHPRVNKSLKAIQVGSCPDQITIKTD